MRLVLTDRSEAGRPRDIGMGTGALAWLVLAAIPLALIDVAVHRLPDPLTAAAFTGTLALLAVAALAGHQPGRLARAAIGAAILACFYLALWLIRPDGMGLGDAKLAASIGLVLGWTSWQALLTGTFAGFALAAVYGGVRMARHQATRTSQLPLGPFILSARSRPSRSYMCRFLFLPSLSRFCCRLSGPSETRKRGKRRWATCGGECEHRGVLARQAAARRTGGRCTRSRTGAGSAAARRGGWRPPANYVALRLAAINGNHGFSSAKAATDSDNGRRQGREERRILRTGRNCELRLARRLGRLSVPELLPRPAGTPRPA